MTSQNRVSRLAGVLHYLTIAAMVFLVVMAGVILYGTQTVVAAQRAYPNLLIQDDLPQGLLFASAVVAIMSLVVWFWTLDQMRRLFAGYKKGAILTDGSAWFIQRIGLGFLGVAVLELLRIPAQTILLTWANPAGQRALSIGFTSDVAGLFLAAGLMTVIGWAMREASDVATENKAFV